VLPCVAVLPVKQISSARVLLTVQMSELVGSKLYTA
jgi:hypothetical protein